MACLSAAVDGRGTARLDFTGVHILVVDTPRAFKEAPQVPFQHGDLAVVFDNVRADVKLENVFIDVVEETVADVASNPFQRGHLGQRAFRDDRANLSGLSSASPPRFSVIFQAAFQVVGVEM